MLGVSFVIMYGAMFLNIAQAEHIHLSSTRTCKALLMVAPMALLMVLMMGNVHHNKARNRVMLRTGALVLVAALVALPAQVPSGAKPYMKAMIPHHSSAILTSSEANETRNVIFLTHLRDLFRGLVTVGNKLRSVFRWGGVSPNRLACGGYKTLLHFTPSRNDIGLVALEA